MAASPSHLPQIVQGQQVGGEVKTVGLPHHSTVIHVDLHVAINKEAITTHTVEYNIMHLQNSIASHKQKLTYFKAQILAESYYASPPDGGVYGVYMRKKQWEQTLRVI